MVGVRDAAAGVGLAQRLRFLDFTDADAARLRSMSTEALACADEFVDRLYDHLQRFEVTRELLVSPERVARLKLTQRAYFAELFTSPRDADYVARRVRIGVVHHRVRLPPQFYLGTYCRYICDLAPALTESSDDPVADLAALLKAVFLDAGLVLEAYFQTLAAETLAEGRARADDALVAPPSREPPAAPSAVDQPPAVSMSVMVNEEELHTRRAFVGFDDATAALLRAGGDKLETALAAMLEAFYERLRAEPELARTLAAPGTIERLQRAQDRHWRQLIRGPFDRAFAASRVAVGRTHEHIDLAPHWFLSGVCVAVCELLPTIFDGKARPTDLLSALIRAVFFDLTFVLDAYMQARLEHLLNIEGYATALIARIPTALLVVDEKHRVVASNRPALAALDYDGALLLGTPIEHVLPAAGLSASINEARATERPTKNLLVQLTGAAGQRLMRVSIIPMHVENDHRKWLALMLDDITELREHDAVVRRTSDWLHQLADGVPGVIWQATPESGRIEAIAGRVEELTGMTADEWLQIPGGIGARVPTPDRGGWSARLQRLHKPGDSVDIEHDLAVADDQAIRMRSSITLATDEDGRRVWRGLSNDISEEVRLRHELERRLDDERELARLAALAVETTELRDLYSRACATLHRMLDCDGVLIIERGPDSETVKRAVSERGVLQQGHEAASPFPAVDTAAFASASHPVFELNLLRARQARRVLVAPIRGAEPDALLVAYCRDETRGTVDDVAQLETIAGLVGSACQRQAYQRQQVQQGRRAALGSLAAGVAHDFNNVLQAQFANLGMLRRRVADDPVATEMIDRLQDYTENGRELVGQVLGFARPVGQHPETAIDDVARSAVELAAAAGDHDVTIESNIHAGVAVRGEPSQLRRVIVNLVDNAVKASPSGGVVTIDVVETELKTTRRTDTGLLEPGAYAVVRVSDRGTGMSAEVRQRMFDPFFTTRASAGGTGLGLSIVHTVVTALGGAISLDSAPGDGTCFEIWLPAGAPVSTSAAATEAEAKSANARLLLVEDNDAARSALTVFLESAGYEVSAFADAESALQQAQAGSQPEVVVSDIVLPGTDGTQLVRKLRRRYPEIAVVVITGEDYQVENEVCLRKPFPLSTLVATIESVLARR